MALKKKPVAGMKDMAPDEAALRDYVTGVIKEVYSSFGFSSIETPCVEHLENLCSRQGGENEKLIFKILKRGEKLKAGPKASEDDLADCALRYDLTVPLCRYYAEHENELPSPFKALQVGNVWRAERPQKGRFRQFVQCDIDILGEEGNLAEIELILAATSVLGKLGFKGFTVKINDRRFLKAMAAYSGFEDKDLDEIFIILDKTDKIGFDGVKAELEKIGCPGEAVGKYMGLFAGTARDAAGVRTLKEKLGGFLEQGAAESLEMIINSVESAKDAEFSVCFDPSLVRGMSYYTGTIYEVLMDDFGSSVGGGGRYDRMVGNFAGHDVPAAGFSIGFERIIMLLAERGCKPPAAGKKKAFLIEKNMSAQGMQRVLEEARKERLSGTQTLIASMKKNRKFQKSQLKEQGYEDIREFYSDQK